MPQPLQQSRLIENRLPGPSLIAALSDSTFRNSHGASVPPLTSAPNPSPIWVWREIGFGHTKVALSIGVQLMVRSDIGGSGVMFSIDTESGLCSVVLIAAALGLGDQGRPQFGRSGGSFWRTQPSGAVDDQDGDRKGQCRRGQGRPLQSGPQQRQLLSSQAACHDGRAGVGQNGGVIFAAQGPKRPDPAPPAHQSLKFRY